MHNDTGLKLFVLRVVKYIPDPKAPWGARKVVSDLNILAPSREDAVESAKQQGYSVLGEEDGTNDLC